MQKLSLGILSGVFAAIVMAAPAFAWSFNVYGTGQCRQQDGKYQITWTIDNSKEREDLKITKVVVSSPEVITPALTAPATVGAGQKASYTQIVSGTTKADYTLKVTGHWKHDTTPHTYIGKASVCNLCAQPQTPPTNPDPTPDPDPTPVTPTDPVGGMGAGSVDPVAAPVAQADPQVVTPIGAVNAGNGGAPKALSLASVAGLIGSALALGFGIRGLKKQ